MVAWKRMRAAVVVMWACASMVACAGSSREDRGKTRGVAMNENHNSDAQCIGRFQFSAPEVFQVTRRSQTIYRVEVSTIPLPSGGAPAAWQDRLARIRGGTLQPGTADPIVKTFELQPGMPAVWFIGDTDSPQLRNLQALKPVGNHFVQADALADAGQETLAEGLVRGILNAYHPGTSQGFCIGYGSITLEPAQIEKTSLELTHRKLADLKLRFDTQTVKEPDTKTLSTVEEEDLVIGAKDGRMSVLRNQPRIAAGLSGTEIRISVLVPGEPPFVRFSWHFPGAPINGVKPQIDIVGSAPTEQQSELETVWEAILQSLRPVPLAPR